MAESQSFSIGVDRLLQQIQPHGRDESRFPAALDDVQARRKDGEGLQPWFARLVDECCGGEPKVVAIEDNMAVFARLGWKGKKQLSYANIQTVVAESDLDAYYLDPHATAVYLRLDFDYKSLGSPFSHPLAHIHIDNDLSPRFSLDGGNCGNIVVDYLEFLYRNYAAGKWLRWAEREWEREFVKSAAVGDINPFRTIVSAFAASQFQILRDHSSQLSRVKRTLRKRKDDLFKLHMDGSDREIMEYPSAR